MAEQPAATAASGNPNLTTLVQAVQAADLVDTLNSEGPFTIFAPANCAFEDIPEDDLNALLEDTDQLTTALTYHVVQGEALSADDLAGLDSATTSRTRDGPGGAPPGRRHVRTYLSAVTPLCPP